MEDALCYDFILIFRKNAIVKTIVKKFVDVI